MYWCHKKPLKAAMLFRIKPQGMNKTLRRLPASSVFFTFRAYCTSILTAFVMLLLLLSNSNLNAQTTVPFNATGTWYCPAGVSTVQVECWAGGGAGGGATGAPAAGGGGAGGSYVKNTSIAVTAGTTYTVTVGTGGIGGLIAGPKGGDSWFNTTSTIRAIGGNGGALGNVSNVSAAGAAITTGNVGATAPFSYYGGSGGTGGAGGASGGGGGSSAGGNTVGAGANGNNAAGLTGGGAVAGTTSGAGVNGSATSGDGADNFNLAGGGAGGRTGTTTDRNGGNGGNGRILITYTQLVTYKSELVSMDLGPANWCPGETRNVTIQIKNIGTATWTDANPDINIGAKWNTNGVNWTDYHVRVNAGNLAPGATGTYVIPITASNNAGGGYTTPLALGANNLRFDVVYEGVAWFGNNNNGVGPGNIVFVSPSITIAPLATPTANANQIFCGSSNPTVAGLTATGSNIKWYLTPSGGTALSPATLLVGGTHYYASQSNGWGCESIGRVDVLVTFTADASISLSSAAGTAAQTLCSNNPITNITYIIGGSGTGATVSGLPTGVTGSFAAGVFTISGTPTVNGVFNYLVSTTGPCLNSNAGGTLTVNPNGTLTLTSAPGTNTQSLCISSAMQQIDYLLGGDATGASLTAGSLPPGITTNLSGGIFSISGTATLAGVYNYTITASGSACANSSVTGTITVNDDATIAFSSAAGTDLQSLCINTPITNITYTVGGGGTGASVIGLPAGVTSSFAAGILTISGSPTVTGVFNYTVSATGPCINPSFGGTITVSTDGTISLQSPAGTNAQVVCINTAIASIDYAIGGDAINATITAGALPAGVTGTFNAGVFSITGTPTAAGVFNYTITVSGSGCANLSASGSITVNDDASISLSSAPGSDVQSLCINNPITSITYSIGGSATGANVTGLPAGVTASVAAGTVTISGTPTVAGLFNYTVATTGPCIVPAASGSITVDPNATITLSSAAGTNVQTRCINNAITTITYSIGGNGTGASITSGGLPAGVTGIYNAGVFSISGTPTVSGVFNFTVTASGSSCLNLSASGTITVNADATISLSSAAGTTIQTVCVNTAISNISYLVGGSGTGATVSGLPAGVTGSFAGNTFTISGIPTVTGSFNYLVSTTGPCIKPSMGGTITVQANSTISLTSGASSNNQTRCINNAMSNITFAIGGGATGAIVSGLPTGVTGTYNAGVFTISGTPTVSGSFPYSVTTTGPCINPSSGGTITVNDNATILLTSAASTTSQILCVNTALTAITYSIGGGGTGATVSGLPTGVTGSYNSGTKIYTISGTPSVAGTFNYTVTTTGPCLNTALGGTIIVQANSTLTRTSAASTTAQTVCINNAITNIVYTMGGGATGVTASNLPPGVTGTLVGNTFTISGVPTVSATYNYTVSTTGPCINPSLGGSITVNDNATISLTSAAATTAQTVCVSTPITSITYLIGGGGTGATVAGLPAGIVTNYNAGTKIFTISGSPSASGTFNYTITTTGPCIKPALTGSITVIPNATIILTSGTGTDAQTVCTNTPITNITYLIAASGTGATVAGLPPGLVTSYSAGTFTISGSPSAPGNYNYTVTTTGPCGQSAINGVITVKAIPVGTLVAIENSGTAANDNIICAGAPVSMTATSGFTAYKFYVNNVVVQNAGPSNTYNTTTLVNGDVVKVEVFNAVNCATFFNTVTVTVNPIAVGTLTASENSGTPNDNIICPGTNILFTATAGFVNYRFKVNGIDVQSSSSNTFNSTTLTNGSSVTVHVTNANGCISIFGPQVITVNPVPTGVLSSSATTVCSGTNVTFTATAGFALYEFKINSVTVQGPSALNTYSSNTLINPSVVMVIVSSSAGCSATFNPLIITVNSLPTGTLTVTENSGTANDNIICSGGNVVFTFNAGMQQYDFMVNGISQQSGSSNTYSNSALVNGDVVSLVVTNGLGCSATFTAPAISVIQSPVGILSVSPATICAGEDMTFTATAGFQAYNFMVNGITVQIGPSNTFMSNTLVNGDVVSVEVTSANNCVTIFNQVTANIISLPAGTMAISENSGLFPNDAIICTGAAVSFTAPTGFTNYNFLVDGSSVQNGISNIYTSTTLATGNIVSVAVTNTNGCIALLNSFTMTVNTNPVVQAITGTLQACVNSSTQLANATAGGIWSSQNNTIATVDASGLVSAISGGTVQINYTVTNANGCNAIATATVTVNPLPVVGSITGNLNLCTGTTSQLNNLTAAGVWNSSDLSVATITPSGLVSGLTAGTTTITYTVTNGSGCSNFQSALVTVNPLPIVDVITGTMGVCINSTSALANNTNGGVWSSSDVSIATINNSTGLVTGVSAGVSTISYTITDGNSCSTTVTADITVYPLPVPTLSGPNPICPNSTATYSTEAGQFNYVWTFSGGTLISGGTSTDNSITIVWDQPGVRNIFVNYTDANGCTGVTSATLTTTTGTIPTLTGTNPVCVNSDGSYSTQSGQTDYSWIVSGGVISTGGSSTDNTATITWTSAGTGTVSINFTDVNGCTGAVPTVIPVTVNPLPTVITHDQFVCSPNTANLTAASVTAGSTPGLTFTYWTDAAATVSYPTPATAGNGIYFIKGTSAAGCSSVQQVTVTVTAAPSASISYPGGPFCTTSGIIAVTHTGNTGGIYSAPSGLTINASTGTITPSTSSNGTYTITYTIVAAGGCSIYTTTTQVTITTAPSATIAYTGGPYCTSSAPVNVSLTGTGGGVFSSTAGLTINPSTGVITPATSSNGTYTVNYTIAVAGGCAQFSTSTLVTITAQPSATITYAGGPFCTSAAPVTVTRTGTPGGVYSSTAGLTINSSTGTITASSSSGGLYTVTYTIAASGGCGVYTTTTQVTITTGPSATAGTPISICANNGPINITAGASASNQSGILWTSSGTAGTIANANSLVNATYTPSAADIAAGFVTLTLTANGNGNCVAATSTKTVTINAMPGNFIITPASAAICQGVVVPLSASVSLPVSASQTFNSAASLNLTIPENNNNGRTTTLNVAGIPAGAIINSVSVQFNISHGWVSDLILNVHAPNGQSLNLVNRKGTDGNNFTNTVISSASVAPIAGNAPFTGTYAPDAANGIGATGNVSNVPAFANLYSIPNGTWTFSALDVDDCHGIFCLSGAQTGSITNWSITINYTVPAVPIAAIWSPISGLFTDPGGTIAYAGQALSTVFAKPISTTTYTATQTNAANCVSTKTVTVSVSPIPVVNITADYCAVPGKVRLTASSTPAASSYLWSTGATTSFIDVDVSGTFTVYAFASSGCYGSATINVATELVVNGDFEAGNVGFVTPPIGIRQYVYQPDIPGNTELYPENKYGIGTDGQNYHDNFWGKDHTTGAGNFMIVNGYVGTPQPIIWQETVTVLPSTTYYFSAWGLNLNSAPNYPQLQFNVNGTQVGSIGMLPQGVSNNSNNGWTRFYGTWTSGPTVTNAVISITDLQTAPGGNDFGLDDISFATLSTFITLESGPGSDAQVVCKGTAIGDIRYNVGNGNPTAPTVTGLPAGVTTVFAGSELTISGTPTVAGLFTYTVTTTGCNTVSATGTITVQQQSISLTSGISSPVVCINSPVSIGYTIAGTATSATVTALPAGLTGSLAGNVYTISGSPSVTGAFPYTVTTSGTCTPVTISGTITVQAQSITHNSGSVNQTLCVNTTIANILYNVGGTATGAIATGLPPGVTGSYISGVFIISGTPTSAAGSPYNYTVTSSGPCAGAIAVGTITVTPAANISLSSGSNTTSVCKATAMTNIVYSVTNAVSASVSGLPAGVTGNFSAGVFTISGTPTVTGVFNYTVTSSGGCGTATATGSITVQSQTISLSSGVASPTLCVNTALNNIVYTMGGTAAGVTVSGLPAGVTYTVSGNTITINGTPTVAGPANYTISTTGACAAVSATGTINVQALAIGGAISSVSICSSASGSLTLIGHNGSIVCWEYSTNGGATWTPIVNNTITHSFNNVTAPIMYRVKVTNGCGTVYSSVATVGIHNYWSGNIDDDWNKPGNWSDNQLPSNICMNVFIPGGTPNQPRLSTGTAAIQNLFIFPGATLTVDNATFKIAGNIMNSGVFDLTNGTLELNGTGTAQTIAGDYFKDSTIRNLVVSNDVNISSTVNNNLNILGTLSFGNAAADLNTGDNLVFKSTLSGTSNLGVVGNSNLITGNATVERYIPNHSKAWQFLAVPLFGNQTVNQAWQDSASFANQNRYPGYGTMMTSNLPGAVGLGFDVFTAAGPSIKVYNSLTDGYNGIPNTTTLPIYNAKGYMVLVRGDRSVIASNQPATATVLRAKGKLFTPADAPSIINVGAGRFESIANPYASAIDFSLITKSGGVQTDFFYLWDPKLTTTTGAGANSSYGLGGFQTFSWNGTDYDVIPGGGSYIGNNRYIESGQAFFVKAPFAAGSVSFSESCKVNGSNNVNRLLSDAMQLRTNLHAITAAGSILTDGALVQFDNAYSNDVDIYDATKLVNTSENLGLSRNGKKLAVERRSEVRSSDTIYLNATQLRAQQYEFECIPSNMDVTGLMAFVEDNYLRTSTPISLVTTTRVAFNVINDPGSYAADRFKIVFKQLAPLPVTITNISATRNSDKTVEVSWKVESETSMKLYTVERSADGRNFTGIITADPTANNGGRSAYSVKDLSALANDNFYRIKALSLSGLVQYSNIVKVVAYKMTAGINVYPNPVTGRVMQVEFSGQDAGSYELVLINSKGQQQKVSTLTVSGNRSVYPVQLPAVLAAGIYRLQVTGPKNMITIKTIQIAF